MAKSSSEMKFICCTVEEKDESSEIVAGKVSATAPSSFFVYLVDFAGTSSFVFKDYFEKELGRSVREIELLGAAAVFDKLIDKVNLELSKQYKDKDFAWPGKLNALLCYVDPTTLYLSQCGDSYGYIFRKNKISSLTEKPGAKQSHPNQAFLEIVSGELELNDQLIFATRNFLQHVPLERLRTISKSKFPLLDFYQLCQNLRRNKLFEACASYFWLNDSAEFDKLSQKLNEPIPEQFYLDEPDERLKKYYSKNVAPKVKFLKEESQILSKQILKYSRLFFKKVTKLSKKYILPQFQKLQLKISNSLEQKTEKSDAIFMPGKNIIGTELAHKNIKIKTNTYQKTSSEKPKFSYEDFASIVANIWNLSRSILRTDKRKYIYLLLILIVVIVGYSKIRQNSIKKDQQIQAIVQSTAYDSAKKQSDELQADIKLGKTVENSRIDSIISLARQALNVPADKDKALTLIKSLNAIIDNKSKIERMYPDNAASFGSSLTKMTLVGANLYGFNDKGQIFTFDTRDNSTSLITSLPSNAGKPVDLCFFKSQSQIAIYTDASKVFLLNTDKKSVAEISVVEDPKSWGKAVAIATYSSNLYLFDNTTGNVNKFMTRDGGYSKASVFISGSKNNLKNAIDFAVDGNVFVLNADGTASKFVKAAADTNFQIRDIPAPDSKIKDPNKIFTDEDTDKLFILDKSANRLLQFDKTGEFVKQYVLDGGSIDDFAINAKLQKIWLLSGGKIYSGNL
ncbi:MAG: hypothetical protein NTW50_03230 [Candidatus Berkelbacteria bacterium]|nr:hypothetical protein [Candidatus Berkelbacteria bacterium]